MEAGELVSVESQSFVRPTLGIKLEGRLDLASFVLPLSALVLLWAVTRMGLLDDSRAARNLAHRRTAKGACRMRSRGGPRFAA